jgi:hypothetical protein
MASEPYPSTGIISTPPYGVAVLIHGITWSARGKVVRLSDHLSICKFRGSRIAKLYRELCKVRKIDDGEDLGFDVFFEIHQPLDLLTYPMDPWSPIAESLNLLAILMGRPLNMCRLIWTRDCFVTADETNVLFHYRPQLDLGGHFKSRN